jgi:hypothetical protein
VIFIIRTRGNPLKSRAHPVLTATSLAVVAIAVLLPFTSIGAYFGFVPPPARFYFILGAIVLVNTKLLFSMRSMATGSRSRWDKRGRGGTTMR